MLGSAHADSLAGNTQNNYISGGRGDDIIDGGGGNDELWGDDNEFGVDGADTFVLAGPAHTDLKRIMDFDVQDHIEISRSSFGLHIQYQLMVGSTLIIAHASPMATSISPTFLVEQSTGNSISMQTAMAAERPSSSPMSSSTASNSWTSMFS